MTVETGEGLRDADSYVSVEFADAYLTARGAMRWMELGGPAAKPPAENVDENVDGNQSGGPQENAGQGEAPAIDGGASESAEAPPAEGAGEERSVSAEAAPLSRASAKAPSVDAAADGGAGKTEAESASSENVAAPEGGGAEGTPEQGGGAAGGEETPPEEPPREETPEEAAARLAKEAALVNATDFVDASFKWRGRKRSPEQALAFPRVGCVDDDGFEAAGVPEGLKKAVCEAALVFAEGKALFQTASENGAVVSEKIGELAFTYDAFRKKEWQTLYDAVNLRLRGLFIDTSKKRAVVGEVGRA